MPLYTPAAGCETQLDSWCARNCPHAQGGTLLYARYDTNAHGHDKAWRCYAASTLDRSLQRFARGDTYCTRHPQLLEELTSCKAEQARSSGFDSETEYGPDGAAQASQSREQLAQASQAIRGAQMEHQARIAEQQRQQQQRSTKAPSGTPAAAAQGAATSGTLSPRSLESLPLGAADRACADRVPECSVWAAYGECTDNRLYMHSECAAACRTCQSVSPSSPPRTPPRAPPPPPSPPPTPPPQKPTGLSPDEYELRTCKHACEPSASGGAPCGGRGRCADWQGRAWCVCDHTQTMRRAGLTCNLEYGEGVACAAKCEEHGRCVHGYCECDAGWHGADCATEGPADAFVSVGRLHRAGLVRGRKGSKRFAEAACQQPSWMHAFARNASQMNKLLASLPDEHPQLRCATCAVVSNAGSLLSSKHGDAIDANECVWRMNRAPTRGFEAHVGSRTTLDYVNSFPHLRDIRILPRLDTPILHGTTVRSAAARAAPRRQPQH